MARRERIQQRPGSPKPDNEPVSEPLPRRPAANTRPAAVLLDRIRRVLDDARTNR